MELIRGEHLKMITDCVTFARRFLLLPDTISYYFEDCPSLRFPSSNNAAESDVNSICFNKQWFLNRIDAHRDDVEFFIFHELRHIHQLFSIYLHDNGRKCNDSTDTIELWRSGFQGYIRNTDATTQAENVVQEVEIDANAYAQCLVNFMHIDDDMELHFSIPEEAATLAYERSGEYYTSKPELKQYLDQARAARNHAQNPQSTIRKVRKVGANEPCPCGSGAKFKRCCRGKGIYD